MNLLSIVPWYWRLAAIAALAVAVYASGWIRGREGEAEKFETYKAQVKVVGDAQNALAAQQASLFKQYKESADEEALRLRDARDRALSDAQRVRIARAGRRLVPADPRGASGSGRICYPADQLDREIAAALDEAAREDLEDAAVGQAGIDVATIARNHAQAVIEGVKPKPGFQRVTATVQGRRP